MKAAIKVLVTAALLWLLVRSVDTGAVLAMLTGIDPVGLLLALFLTGLIVFADALLFAGTMQMLARHVPISVSLLYSLVAWFFSNVAPSTVGGDVFRGVQMSRLGTPVQVAVRAVVIMRVASLGSLCLIMLAGLPVAWGLVGKLTDLVIFGVLLLSAGGGLAILFLLVRIPVPERISQRWPMVDKVRAASGDLRKLVFMDIVAAKIWMAAAAQHLLRVLILAALAAALGLDIPFAALFAFVPAALLAAMLPVSFGGWGVREAALVYLLGTTGVSGEAALSLSIAFGLLRIALGAVGGIVWAVVDKDRFRVDASSA